MASDKDDAAVSAGPLTNEERLWGMLCHLSALLGYFTLVLTFIGPLVCWLMKKDTSPYVDYHGKEALNFQLNILIYKAVCIALFCVVAGFFLFGAVVLYNVILVIVAGIKANAGEKFRYPFILRFVR